MTLKWEINLGEAVDSDFVKEPYGSGQLDSNIVIALILLKTEIEWLDINLWNKEIINNEQHVPSGVAWMDIYKPTHVGFDEQRNEIGHKRVVWLWVWESKWRVTTNKACNRLAIG